MRGNKVLEVGINLEGEVVVNHPDLEPDENGCGYIIFSPTQARAFAQSVLKKADEAEELLTTKQGANET
jgi:hypothetical protein